jgi:hypothetical protein
MTSAHQLFSSLKKQDLGVQVELGDDAKYPVAKVGTIPFQFESGNSLDVDDVLFVPGLKKNLLSVSVMEDKGFAMEFKNQQVLIRPKDSSPNTAQVTGVREGNLDRLQGEPIRAFVHNSENLCKLWHKRMEHLHHRAFPILRKIVTCLVEFSIEQHGVCRGCTLGRHVNVAFPSSKHRPKGILDLVHSDVYGPMSVALITGSMYYVSFIDDFSSKTWIYFLKTKDEVFSRFQEFKALVENQTKKKIKV